MKNVLILKKNNKKPRLSVIVPMYNAERWIKRCIQSILGQLFRDFEVIIINDGSTDNSFNIVNSYCRIDQRIRCISTKNQGSAMAKNIGLKYASGDIVSFVDADDFIEDRMYEIMISVLDDLNADIVECSCYKRNIYGRKLCNISLINEKIEGNEQCTIHFMKQQNTRNYMCNKIYKRKLFEGIYFPLLYFSEDYYMNAVLHSKSNKKVIISQAFYNYMIYPEQSTNNKYINTKRIDGMKAGNMVANFFAYDKKLKNYATLYTCNYALFIADKIYNFDHKVKEEFLRSMRPELFKALSHISFDILQDRKEKRIVYQCALMLIANTSFFDFRWLFE